MTQNGREAMCQYEEALKDRGVLAISWQPLNFLRLLETTIIKWIILSLFGGGALTRFQKKVQNLIRGPKHKGADCSGLHDTLW